MVLIFLNEYYVTVNSLKKHIFIIIIVILIIAQNVYIAIKIISNKKTFKIFLCQRLYTYLILVIPDI